MLQKMRKNVKGFTLIELMIVIAIIGILAAIAIPQFVKYRARSFNTQSLGDVRVVSNEVGGYYGEWTEYPLDTVAPIETNGAGIRILNTAGNGPPMEPIAVSANSVMSYTGATNAGGYAGGASDGKQFAVFSGSKAAVQEIALVFAHRDTDGTTAGDVPSNENFQFWPDELITVGTAEMDPTTNIRAAGWVARGN